MYRSTADLVFPCLRPDVTVRGHIHSVGHSHPVHKPQYRTSKSIRALVADTGTKSCGIESREVTVFIQK